MKIQLNTPVITDLRGSLGGAYATQRRGTAIIRKQTTPSNPQTALQQNRRHAVAVLNWIWPTLPAALRLPWEAQALEKNITPFNAFCDAMRAAALDYLEWGRLFMVPRPGDAPGPATMTFADAWNMLHVFHTRPKIPPGWANPVFHAVAFESLYNIHPWPRNYYRTFYGFTGLEAIPAILGPLPAHDWYQVWGWLAWPDAQGVTRVSEGTGDKFSL